MIYPHQQKAIAYITNKFLQEEYVQALLISGSIMHGFNDETSDVDINIVVSEELYQQKRSQNALTYYEDAENFYSGGYFDGKFISLGYLSLVAKRGNEPTRFALHDVDIAFDRTGKVSDLIKQISIYNTENIQQNAIRLISQMDGWKWYCGEAIRRNNQYLLDTAVSRLILFVGRLILLENREFFPYHKWFMAVLERCENKPADFMPAVHRLLENKTHENIKYLCELVKGFRDWSGGAKYSWTSNFVEDVETIWMRQDEFIENM